MPDQKVYGNPYVIKLKVVDNLLGVNRVEFYIDEQLVCISEEETDEGYYECSWDPGKYHSDIRIDMYDKCW